MKSLSFSTAALGQPRCDFPPVESFYHPWNWMVWWSRWHFEPALAPLWDLCARDAMGQICLNYAPASPENDSARFNPLAEVRLRTPNEIRDVRNIAQMIMDPNGKRLPDHWLRAGVEGFTRFTLAQLYEDRDPTLSGIEARLFDPDQPIDQTLDRS